MRIPLTGRDNMRKKLEFSEMEEEQQSNKYKRHIFDFLYIFKRITQYGDSSKN